MNFFSDLSIVNFPYMKTGLDAYAADTFWKLFCKNQKSVRMINFTPYHNVFNCIQKRPIY